MVYNVLETGPTRGVKKLDFDPPSFCLSTVKFSWGTLAPQSSPVQAEWAPLARVSHEIELQELPIESWAGVHRYGKCQADVKDIKSICQ